jgi:tetratricopeptide (TPR) repeat protein
MYDSAIWAHGLLGRFGAAEEAHTKAVALLGNDPTAGIELWGMSSLLSVKHMWAYVLLWMGRFGEAERELRRACEVAKQHRQLDMLCWMEASTVYLARLGGNVVRPLDNARSAIELAEKIGNALARVLASRALGMAHGLAGEWPASIAALESAVTLARDRRAWLLGEPWLLASLAESYAGAGHAELARARAERQWRWHRNARRGRRRSKDSLRWRASAGVPKA